jgi:hypothetical protein
LYTIKDNNKVHLIGLGHSAPASGRLEKKGGAQIHMVAIRDAVLKAGKVLKERYRLKCV